ncbi:hypothetical protein TARUN_2606 [Trichoderma arundinaceum]|uniref:Uncharacterized protein n=1 Tax=Trichoderma arundinaceum TaxID=490622 RepID=A0A395NUI4_TRIAR|nr:hypothetical protein TARUN_2606 [Trichoderma arundinaceum]
MTMQQPAPPSAEESELYYYGLPSCPRLVARSSTHIWQNPQMPGFTTFTGTLNMYPKSLRPAGRHPLLHQLWNNATSSLRVQIVEAVSAASDWTAIDILRVGLNKEFYPTLLLAVKPDSLSWSRGHAIALRCKAILEDHGIHDVHCEIRESVVTLCTGGPSTTDSATEDSTPNDFQLSSMPITTPNAAIRADLSDCLGTKIAMKDMDGRAGTKGLYLALSPSSPSGGEPRIVVLTCRHVVIDPKTEGLQTYSRQASEPLKEVIQVDQPAFEEMLERLECATTQHRNAADRLSEQGKTDSAAIYSHLADSSKALLEAIKPYEASSSRVFGQLLYAPEFNSTSSGHGATWLRDWALIELLPGRHQAQHSALKNKVFVEALETFLFLVENNRKGWKGLPEPLEPIVENCTVELQQVVVPMGEIFSPVHFAEYVDEPAILVAKYGARGGLTLGLGNTLKSVVRHTETLDGDRESMSEEWAITSVSRATDRQAAFSKKGDSGSCIWDMAQRVAGIVMAGGGINGVNDVTYAQPVERLLADIRAHGFNVSLV